MTAMTVASATLCDVRTLLTWTLVSFAFFIFSRRTLGLALGLPLGLSALLFIIRTLLAILARFSSFILSRLPLRLGLRL